MNNELKNIIESHNLDKIETYELTEQSLLIFYESYVIENNINEKSIYTVLHNLLNIKYPNFSEETISSINKYLKNMDDIKKSKFTTAIISGLCAGLAVNTYYNYDEVATPTIILSLCSGGAGAISMLLHLLECSFEKNNGDLIASAKLKESTEHNMSKINEIIKFLQDEICHIQHCNFRDGLHSTISLEGIEHIKKVKNLPDNEPFIRTKQKAIL